MADSGTKIVNFKDDPGASCSEKQLKKIAINTHTHK